jgi:hypothetical protein
MRCLGRPEFFQCFAVMLLVVKRAALFEVQGSGSRSGRRRLAAAPQEEQQN